MANEVQLKEGTVSERFTNKVIAEFRTGAGDIEVSDHQRGLIQGYFISIDRALKLAEENRVRKNEKNTDHKWDNTLPVNWDNVNLNDLAIDLMHYSKIGLDMMADNHLSPIPYKNSKTNKYDIGFIEGYEGIKFQAEKYALIKPLKVTIELVHKNDEFRAYKKGKDNPIESYSFDITNPFDRGEPIGGFGYLEYENPRMNELIIMTEKDILKRKPEYAAVEFWGGEKEEYQNGKRTGKKEHIEGWKEEMYYKTLVRYVYGKISIDPDKIDESYRYTKMREARISEYEAMAEIAENSGKVTIDTTGEVIEVKAEPVEGPNF